MRGSESEKIASQGISAVCSAFVGIDWGAVENARHDLGTDLFLLARDQRMFDPGLVVGAQVKAGDSYFRKPVREGEGPAGWWYYESDRSHFDYWASHGLPHLLVLHDLAASTSYWAHVTPESVVSTGKGAKVLVPAANTVDAAHRDELLAVAATLRSGGVEWEGSAWSGPPLAPRDLLRHALITPRLVAPHPNAGHKDPLTPEQAVALVVQARLASLDHFADVQPAVPTLAEAKDSPEWLWRFVGALGAWMMTANLDDLLTVAGEAPNPATRAASAASAATALLTEARAEEGLAILEAALAPDDAEPVDHAWLTGQHARLCVEIGRIDSARAEAAELQTVRSVAPRDVTATAIAGSAAILLFNTSDWRNQDLAGVIAGADTAAGWWRTQTTAHGLEAIVERTFSDWSRDPSVTIGGDDVANNELFAASIAASHAGDQSSWRHLSNLLGRDMLIRLDRHAEPQLACEGLAVLRFAGDEKAIKLATAQLVADGPAAGVTLAAAGVDLAAATRTTAPADLALLTRGGDVLSEETVAGTIDWLLATLRDPSAFVARTRPSYILELRLLEVLVGVAPAAQPADRRAIVERLVELPSQEAPMLVPEWAKLIDALPGDTWDEDTARELAATADRHADGLRLPMLGLLARHDPTTRTRLLSDIEAGSLDALAAFGNVTDLPAVIAEGLITALAQQVDQQRERAHERSYGIAGGHDIGEALALLNAWHPDAAKWDALCESLADEMVAAEDKRGALGVLAQLADRLPAEIRTRLKGIAIAIGAHDSPAVSSPFDSEQDVKGAGTYLAAALGSLDEQGAATRLVDLLSGDRHQRQWAAHVAHRLGRDEDVGVLAALAQDSDVGVRGAAAGALASLVAEDRGGALSVDTARRCLDEPGTHVPVQVAANLAGARTRGQVAQEILDGLRTHASARVRAFASACPKSD
jgi:hypothetical protein